MDYRIACVNCGESNYHRQNDISFITGSGGFSVCNNCGFTSHAFPKISQKEADEIKKAFSKSPKYYFKDADKGNGRISTIFFLILMIILAIIIIIQV